MSALRGQSWVRLAAIALTVVAVGVMLTTGTRSSRKNETSESHPRPQPVSPVVVRKLTRDSIEILDSYSGMIRPFERFSLSFEISGRIERLGTDAAGRMLDEGARVTKGQVLAKLDDRIFLARRQETVARLEQAQQNMRRAQTLWDQGGVSRISEVEFQRNVTDLTIAKSQAQIALKSLEDTTLVAAHDGVLSRRFVNAGESVTPQQVSFELVQINNVLLVVGVPESRIQEVVQRQNAVEAMRRNLGTEPTGKGTALRADCHFVAYVELLGKDRYGRPWPRQVGHVYRISETADTRTGLFEVEIKLINSGELKPGRVALAKLVIDRIEGFRLPVQAALFRDNRATIYSVQPAESTVPYLFWNLGSATDFLAHTHEIDQWIEQDGQLIVTDLPAEHRTVVIRGQHRLVDQRRVRIVGGVPSDTPSVTAETIPAVHASRPTSAP